MSFVAGRWKHLETKLCVVLAWPCILSNESDEKPHDWKVFRFQFSSCNPRKGNVLEIAFAFDYGLLLWTGGYLISSLTCGMVRPTLCSAHWSWSQFLSRDPVSLRQSLAPLPSCPAWLMKLYLIPLHRANLWLCWFLLNGKLHCLHSES